MVYLSGHLVVIGVTDVGEQIHGATAGGGEERISATLRIGGARRGIGARRFGINRIEINQVIAMVANIAETRRPAIREGAFEGHTCIAARAAI